MDFKIGVGKSDFAELPYSGNYYVDKTELIYELVHDTDNEAKRSDHESDMKTDCDEALGQIIQRKYAQGLYGYEQIYCYGVAFFQKQAMAKCRNMGK